MLKAEKKNFTKHDISKNIASKIGISKNYSKEIVDDLISVLKKTIKLKQTNIKNFATFKIINKNKRLGRNPKTSEEFIISKRKSVKFTVSKKFKNKINSL